MNRALLGVVLIWVTAAPLWAGGFASNDDFVVQVAGDGEHEVDRSFAEAVAEKASEYRSRIAVEWLGDELPPSVGRTYLTVLATDADSGGRTWPSDGIDRVYHSVHISGTPEQALGGTLAKHVAHVVLATRYTEPNSLPRWLIDGIAVQYDAGPAGSVRKRILAWYAQTGNWPRLTTLMNAEILPAGEKASFAAAESLAEFLLTKGSKQDLLQFGTDGTRDGWDRALKSHYGIEDTDELQVLWEAWAARRQGGTATEDTAD